MSCPVLLDPACAVGSLAGSAAGAAAGTVASDALSSIASAISSGVAWVTANSVSWWVKLPSPDLAAEPAVNSLQQWMLPIAAAVAVFGVIVAGAKMALTRKANPLIDVGSGLATIAATSAVGVLLPTLLLKAGDAWSNWVLQASTGGQFGARLTDLLSMTGLEAPAVVVVLGIVAIILSALQALLMLFRQGALVVLAGALPLAAAGTLTPATRPWFKKVTGWMMALIFYKPSAAAVYAAAFTMAGTGKNLTTILAGLAMIALSLVALPALMRFFTWTTGQVGESSGGGFMQTALSSVTAVGAMRGYSGGLGGSGAADQARQQTQQLGPADGGPSGPRAPAGATSPGPDARRGGNGQRAAGPGDIPGCGHPPGPPGAGTARRQVSRVGQGRQRRRAARGAPRPASPPAPTAGRNATAGAMQPPADQPGDSDEHRGEPGPARLRRLAAAPRHRVARPRAGRHRRRARRPARAGDHRRRQPGRAAVRGAAPAGLRRRGPDPGRRGAAGPGRAAPRPLAPCLLAGLDPLPGQAAAAHSSAWRLPGVLAPLALLDAEDGYGGRYALVVDRRTGTMTATLRVIPASTWLADRQDADTWVANWGGWLASLGYLPAVRHVTVTIDTAPEPGSTLADSVAAALDPAAPLTARQIMGQLVDAAPAAAADVDTRVSITFDPAASPAAPAGLAESAAEVGRTLHGLESALGTCGVTVLGRATPAEVAGAVRTAYDPAARGEADRLLAQAGDGRPVPGLSWAEAGPVGAEEEPGCYRHDSGISLSWSWDEAPRQNVTADVLARLVAPGRYPKRVSLQYRPFSAAEATRTLDAEVNAAQFRAVYKRRTGRDETARDSYDQARARQAAAEEAAGAGVCLVSMYVTVTVTDPGELPRAASETEAAAESSRIRLRRMAYSQAAGWAATLPVGVCPAELARRMPH